MKSSNSVPDEWLDAICRNCLLLCILMIKYCVAINFIALGTLRQN